MGKIVVQGDLDCVSLVHDQRRPRVLGPTTVQAVSPDGDGVTVCRADKILAGGQIEATTKSAYITDLILDGALRVRQSPAAADWEEGDGEIGGRAYALEAKFSLLPTPPLYGVSCVGGGTLSQSFGIQPVVTLEPAFDFDIDIKDVGWLPPRGKLDKALIALSGKIDGVI